MKAFIGEKYGPPETLRMAEVEKPAPDADEVLAKVLAISVNPAAGIPCAASSLLTRHPGVASSASLRAAKVGPLPALLSALRSQDQSSCGSSLRRPDPVRLSTLSSVAGLPRQWSARTSLPAVRSTRRRISAPTMASSKGPAIGVNSGIRSMGEANQATPKRSRSFEVNRPPVGRTSA